MQDPLIEGRKIMSETKNFLLKESSIILEKFKNAKNPDLKIFYANQLNSIKGRIKSEINNYNKLIEQLTD